MIQSMWADRIEDVQRLWKWFLALGIALIMLGIIAVGTSVAVTLASVLLFGILFIISGFFQAVPAFQTRQSKGFFLYLLAGLFDLVVGVLLVTHPTVGALTLTLLLAAFFPGRWSIPHRCSPLYALPALRLGAHGRRRVSCPEYLFG